MSEKIVISSDFSAFAFKEIIKEHLIGRGFEVTDVGTLDPAEPVYYCEAAVALSKEVVSGRFERGIVICGSGMGVAQVCNKFKGISCALVESSVAARKCRFINNSNVLALGSTIVTPDVAKELTDIFLDTKWCEGADPDRAAFLAKLKEPTYALGQELEC